MNGWSFFLNSINTKQQKRHFIYGQQEVFFMKIPSLNHISYKHIFNYYYERATVFIFVAKIASFFER